MSIKRKWGENPDIINLGPLHKYRERKVIKYILKYLPEGLVLDVGSGSGSMSLALAKNNFKVKAIDIDDNCVKYLEGLIARLGLQKAIHAVRADINRVPFPEQYFDGIAAGEILEHVWEDSLVVKEFNRVLKPGGICVVTVPFNPKLYSFIDEWAGHRIRYTKPQLLELFYSNNFDVKEVLFWGFPLGRLYDLFFARHFYRRMIKGGIIFINRIKNKSKIISGIGTVVSLIFNLDNMFKKFPSV